MEGPRTHFGGGTIEHVDLTFADLEDTDWENYTFRDVRADSANISHCVFSGCLFENVRFDGANLNSSVLGGYTGYETNTFRRVSFVKADLRNTVYRFPLFEDCDFSGARFARVDFAASRFVRCRFAGRLGGVQFHGSWDWRYDLGQERDYFRRRGIMPLDIRNAMLNVDFREADLRGVTFWGVDLSRSKLPSDENHVIAQDPRSFFERVKAVLDREWEGADREEALETLDMLIGPGNLFVKKLEETLKTKQTETKPEEMIRSERLRIDRPWHWRATRPIVLSRGFFETKSRPWGRRLFAVLVQVSKEA